MVAAMEGLEATLKRGQTVYLRLLRNEVLEQNVASARERGDRLTEIHCTMLLQQWRLIDDGYDFITTENAKLARQFRTRKRISATIAVAAFILGATQLIGVLT